MMCRTRYALGLSEKYGPERAFITQTGAPPGNNVDGHVALKGRKNIHKRYAALLGLGL